MKVPHSALWVAALVAAFGCGPRGGPGSSTSPTIESVSIYQWGDDPHHGRSTSAIQLSDTGCYSVESDHPLVGPSSVRSCMPADRASALLADVGTLWAEGGWTETSYAGASDTHEEVVYATTSDGKTWLAPTDLPSDELSRLAAQIEAAVTDHYRNATPSPDDEGPLGFAMASFIIVHGRMAYRAELDTRGRWQCAVPEGYGDGGYSFTETDLIAAGSVASDTAASLLADLFDGVSFEPAESRSVHATRVELRNYPGDQGRELLPDATAIVVERWRKRAPELGKGCAVPR